MKSLLTTIIASADTVADLRSVAGANAMILVDSHGTNEAVVEIYEAGHHGLEIAVHYDEVVSATFNYGDGENIGATITAEKRVGNDSFSFHLTIVDGRADSVGAKIATAIAESINLKKGKIRVVGASLAAQMLAAVGAMTLAQPPAIIAKRIGRGPAVTSR